MQTRDVSSDLKNFKRLDEDTVTDVIEVKAKKELNETPTTKRKCLEELRLLLKGITYKIE